MVTLSENLVVWYCVITVIIGLVAFLVLYLFGKLLMERSLITQCFLSADFVSKLFEYYEKVSLKGNIHRSLAESNKDYLQRRNEFWSTYVQVVAAVFIVIVLALLLISKTISAEAGLPILSAVAGFVISKSVTGNSSTGSDNDRDAG